MFSYCNKSTKKGVLRNDHNCYIPWLLKQTKVCFTLKGEKNVPHNISLHSNLYAEFSSVNSDYHPLEDFLKFEDFLSLKIM